jgi:catechol 2,3-dioxygenase-like lactoylglutathione lyase family enzyme
MPQYFARNTLVVENYDDAIDFYANKLGVELMEDTSLPAEGDKRWVVLRPPGSDVSSCALLLAKANNERQVTHVGNQTDGRVGFFLFTYDVERDHAKLLVDGVTIARPLTAFPYGRVLVFADLYGNLWDLIEPSPTTVL